MHEFNVGAVATVVAQERGKTHCCGLVSMRAKNTCVFYVVCSLFPFAVCYVWDATNTQSGTPHDDTTTTGKTIAWRAAQAHPNRHTHTQQIRERARALAHTHTHYDDYYWPFTLCACVCVCSSVRCSPRAIISIVGQPLLL